MNKVLSEKSCLEIGELKNKYPFRKTAILPAFHIIYEELGYLSREALKKASEILELPYLELMEAASFYALFPKEPVGKYLLQVCDCVPCSVLGAGGLIQYLKEKLGIELGQTTPDKLFTLVAVECLASCGSAPMMQINDRYFENLTKEKVDKILEELRQGKPIVKVAKVSSGYGENSL